MTLPLGIGALIASCPILLVLILMIAFKRPAMRAMPIGWVVAAILAFAIWRRDAMWFLGSTVKGFLMGNEGQPPLAQVPFLLREESDIWQNH